MLKSKERAKQVILRTHGGLGNQLFQVLYGRLFAEKFGLDLREVHDIRYKHAFPRSTLLRQPAKSPDSYQHLLSSLRLPKVLQRITKKLDRAIYLFGDAYLDSYFQDAGAYTIFATEVIERHLRSLAAELSIRPAYIDQCLVHLRVIDFFKSRSDSIDHVVQRLSTVSPNSSIITNDEELLAEPTIAALIAAKNCTLVSTAGFPAEDVLRKMAAYRRLDANDSTLVFWSSVLGGGQLTLRNAGLRAIRELFVGSLWRNT